MAIELISGMVLTRAGVSVSGSKLSDADIQKVQSDAKTAAATNTLQASPCSADRSEDELAAAGYSFESTAAPELFSASLPKADADGNYIVGGVRFSESELTQSRSVVQSAIRDLPTGTLDYSDYVKMGLAVCSVETYAEGNLTAEQGQVLKDAMQEYIDYLVSQEKEMLSDGSFVEGNRGELSVYYGKEEVADSTRVEAMNALIDEMNRVSGGNKAHVSAGCSIVVQSATNQSLISEINGLFSGLDLNDSSAVSSAMEKYKDLMTPALLASGTNTLNVNRVLNKQIADFMSQVNGVFAQYMTLSVQA